jgi:hypothetical protein
LFSAHDEHLPRGVWDLSRVLHGDPERTPGSDSP